MKPMILSLVALLLAGTAEARSPITHLSAMLDRFQVDPQLGSDYERVQSGNVEIDLVAQKIRVSLYPRTDARCMPAPKVIELPIDRIVTNSCNVPQYVAETQGSVAGGAFETLTVKDNTKNRCPTFAPLAETEVVYETKVITPNPRYAYETYSRFEGSRLEPGRISGPAQPRCR